MASIQAFGERIQHIGGVKSHILVRHDGHVLGHSVESPEPIGDMTAFSGLSCEAIKPVIGATGFKYLCLSRANKEKFLIFPFNAYFLGVLLHAEAYPPDVAEKIMRILNAVSAKSAQSR